MKAKHQAESNSNPRQRNSNRQGQHGSSFGGSLLKNSHARTARPLSYDRPIQIILSFNSSEVLKKIPLVNQNKQLLTLLFRKILKTQSAKFKIRVLDIRFVHHQIQLIIRSKRKSDYKNWIRAVTGLFPRYLLNTQKGKSLGFPFWIQRPLTQIISKIGSYKGVEQFLYDELQRLQILYSELTFPTLFSTA